MLLPFLLRTKWKHDHFPSSCCFNAKLSCLFVHLNSFWWLLLRSVFFFYSHSPKMWNKTKRIKSFTFIVISLPNFAVWLIANCALVRCIMIKCFFFVYVHELSHTQTHIWARISLFSKRWRCFLTISANLFELSLFWFNVCHFFVVCQLEKETLFFRSRIWLSQYLDHFEILR